MLLLSLSPLPIIQPNYLPLPLGDQDQDQDQYEDQDRDQDVVVYDLFVYDQGGGTPLNSDQDDGAGEEADSPAGGARGVGGVVGEGDQFLLRGPSRRPRQLHFAWRRLRVAQWTPADYCSTPV